MLSDPNTWLSLLTLTFLEIILGVDNLIFITILSAQLPPTKQRPARRLGILLALVTRLLLLATAAWMAKLTTPLFIFLQHAVSGRDLLLLVGGLFLVIKATREIYTDIEANIKSTKIKSYNSILVTASQIALFDIIFSLDSVVTAVGMTTHFSIMAIAIVLAIIVMLVASEPLNKFINQHPSLKMLALSLLLLVGVMLLADSLHWPIPRGYIYFAIAFALLVETLNILKYRGKNKSWTLH